MSLIQLRTKGAGWNFLGNTAGNRLKRGDESLSALGHWGCWEIYLVNRQRVEAESKKLAQPDH